MRYQLTINHRLGSEDVYEEEDPYDLPSTDDDTRRFLASDAFQMSIDPKLVLGDEDTCFTYKLIS